MPPQPIIIKQAVIALWITLAVSVISALISWQQGEYTTADLLGYLVVYALLSIIPYRIARGGYLARDIFTALLIIGYALFFFGNTSAEMSSLDKWLSFFLIPVYGYILYGFYHPVARAWFNAIRQQKKAQANS